MTADNPGYDNGAAGHCWDVRVFADSHRWSYRAICACGWQGQLHAQRMVGKRRENKSVPICAAAEDALAHMQASR